jgi:hypothetical protein
MFYKFYSKFIFIIIKNFEEFCENYKDKEAQKTTKNDIILMIYNNSNKIKNKPRYFANRKKIKN